MIYFYEICITGIVAGVAKALVTEKYSRLINILCCFAVIMSLVSPLRSCSANDTNKKIDSSSYLQMLFASRLEADLEAELLQNEYYANIMNIDCECKDNKMMVNNISYSGDINAAGLISKLTGVSAERIEYIEK